MNLLLPYFLHRYSAYVGHTINSDEALSLELQQKYCDFVNIIQTKYHNADDEDAGNQHK